MAQKFYLTTFGCRTNQADSAAIRADLASRFQETSDWKEADWIVVNSCTITHRSDQQVRQLTRRFHRENPDARIIVTGCYAQRSPESLVRIGGVNAVVGNTEKQRLPEIFSLIAKDGAEGGRAVIFRQDFEGDRSVEAAAGIPLTGRTRPYVKIQDGCDSRCTYCIVPAVRGPSRSVAPEVVLKQIRDLVASGAREVVLTGIHIGRYGVHLKPRYPLARLVESIVSVPGLQRLRISSIEPMELSTDVIRLAARNPGIAPHFHICLQSGSDRLLRRMRRPYTTAAFARIVEEIRRLMPDAGIGTDLIVGFPGETEEDHRQTVEFVHRMPFTYLHVFPYSDRQGTAASTMGDRVDGATAKLRAAELRQLSKAKNQAFRQSFMGRELSVLTLSQLERGRRVAISGNYLKALLDPAAPPNEFMHLRATGEEGEYLLLR